MARVNTGSGMLVVIHPVSCFLPTVCLWFWQGKQEGEGTQRLLQTQEPRVTQSSVNDIPVEYVKELRVFLLEKGADNVRAIFKYLKGCLSGRVINFLLKATETRFELSMRKNFLVVRIAPKIMRTPQDPGGGSKAVWTIIHSFIQQIFVDNFTTCQTLFWVLGLYWETKQTDIFYIFPNVFRMPRNKILMEPNRRI